MPKSQMYTNEEKAHTPIGTQIILHVPTVKPIRHFMI